ncbi:CsiV family protein [Microbulbifer hainanensis]|uniref:CsiV family protein n=1 Tax=Microbulbifer hainanensis TaxID=2735675 RepID=UPI0018661399|nr:CsiV family protein [Microbulbifer hainanensis]
MTRILKLCSALLLTFAAASANAVSYAGTTFEIEMIVFSRTQGMERSSETWPAAPRLQYPWRWVDFQSTNDNGAPALTPVPTQLDNKVAALNRGGQYRVLFHKAWQQVLWQKHRAPAIVISGGDSYRGHRQLEGSVTVSVSHYLHLNTNLWFNDFTGEPTSASILLPEPPKATSDEPLDLQQGVPATGGMTTGFSAPLYAQHVAVLQEGRRLRSGELHYFDSPQLGVLIEVRTVKNPADAAGK